MSSAKWYEPQRPLLHHRVATAVSPCPLCVLPPPLFLLLSLLCPLRLTYRERVLEYHKLLRMVARAFYSTHIEDIVVLDALLHLIEAKDSPGVHSVTDTDIRALIGLPEKRVSATLTKLKAHHLVAMVQKEAEAKKEEELDYISKRGRPQYSSSRARPGVVWYVDYPHVLKVLKLRRFRVFESLNRKVDKADVFYTCPTPACPNHGQQFALIELLSTPSMSGKGGGGFVCDQCEANDRGRMVPTPLVMSGGGDEGGEGGQEAMKARFNEQIRPLTLQMNVVDALLEEQMSNQDELLQDAQQAASTAAASFDAPNTQDITVDISSSGTVEVAGVGTKTVEGPQAGARVLHVPQVRADQAKGMVAALPWAEGGVRGLEEEKKREEESRRKAREEADERQRVAEQQRFQQQYQAELDRMRAAAAEATPAPSDEMAEDGMEEETGEVLVTVGGRDVPLSSITQADLDEMTADELAVYESFQSHF